MCVLKKSIIFDIEQSYFLLNKIFKKQLKALSYMALKKIFYFNQQNLIIN